MSEDDERSHSEFHIAALGDKSDWIAILVGLGKWFVLPIVCICSQRGRRSKSIY